MRHIKKSVSIGLALCLIHTQLAWAASSNNTIVLNHYVDAIKIYASINDMSAIVDGEKEQAQKQELLDRLNAILDQETHGQRLEAYLAYLEEEQLKLKEVGETLLSTDDFQDQMGAELLEAISPYVDVDGYRGVSMAEKLQNIFIDMSSSKIDQEKAVATGMSSDELAQKLEMVKASAKTKLGVLSWIGVAFLIMLILGLSVEVNF